MSTKRAVRRSPRRRGLTLLEMVIASSMLAMVLTSISVVMRSGRVAWEAHEDDFTRMQAAHATVRHIVRNIRQAESVLAISGPDNSISLQMQGPPAEIRVWEHDVANSQVLYGIGAATDLLAPDITGLRFEGYEADGVTPTNVDVQCVRVEVTFNLPNVTNNPQRTVTSWAWVRTW